MLTRARAVVLAVAGLTLAACGNVHPGAAAVVDGRTISMKDLDDTAKVYCVLSLNAAKQQGITAISNTDIRRQAVTGMVSIVVARKLAKEEGLQIKPSSYELTPEQRAGIAKTFPDSDGEQLVKAFEEAQEVGAIAIALAAKTTGTAPSSTNQSQLAEAGQAAISAAFKDNDVEFSPRFGLTASGQPKADTGTLAVSPVDLQAPAAEELPDAQRCS